MRSGEGVGCDSAVCGEATGWLVLPCLEPGAAREGGGLTQILRDAAVEVAADPRGRSLAGPHRTAGACHSLWAPSGTCQPRQQGRWSLRPLAVIMCPVQPRGTELVGMGSWQLEKAPAGPTCLSPRWLLERVCVAGQQGGVGVGAGTGGQTCRLSEALHPLPRPPPSPAPARPEPLGSLVSLPVERRARAAARQLGQEVSGQRPPGQERGGPCAGSPCALGTFSDPPFR